MKGARRRPQPRLIALVLLLLRDGKGKVGVVDAAARSRDCAVLLLWERWGCRLASAWLGWSHGREDFKRITCLLKTSQNCKVSAKCCQNLLEIEKVGFCKRWPETSRKCRKIDVLGEKFVIRESICGHFSSGGLAWGSCKRCISSKTVFEKNVFFRKCFRAGMGSSWEFWARNWRQIDRNGVL